MKNQYPSFRQSWLGEKAISRYQWLCNANSHSETGCLFSQLKLNFNLVLAVNGLTHDYNGNRSMISEQF